MCVWFVWYNVFLMTRRKAMLVRVSSGSCLLMRGYYNCTPAARGGERMVTHHVVLERQRERLHRRAGLPVAAPQPQSQAGQIGVASRVIFPRAGSSSWIIDQSSLTKFLAKSLKLQRRRVKSSSFKSFTKKVFFSCPSSASSRFVWTGEET